MSVSNSVANLARVIGKESFKVFQKFTLQRLMISGSLIVI